MFDEIRYELNGIEIDRSRNVGITSDSYKGLCNDSNEIAHNLHNAGFISNDTVKSLMTDDGYFNFCVSLNILLGFCEDYKRVVLTLVTN